VEARSAILDSLDDGSLGDSPSWCFHSWFAKKVNVWFGSNITGFITYQFGDGLYANSTKPGGISIRPIFE
jgi:hypothetical protein